MICSPADFDAANSCVSVLTTVNRNGFSSNAKAKCITWVDRRKGYSKTNSFVVK